MINEEMLLEDLKAVLKEAKSMGCTEVRRFEHIQLEKVEMIVNALEKQVVKKPHLWGDGYYNGELIIDMYDCPNCEKSYELECEEYDYCPNCGQKLDWSGIDE